MKTPLIIAFVVLSLMLGGLYYQFLYPPSMMRKTAETTLQQFSETVDTQDRTKIGQALSELLTDDAKVRLEVSFSAINSANVRPMTQDFDKATFLTFIDNTLYTLSEYHFRPKLTEFTLGEGEMIHFALTASQMADGPSYYSGASLMMRFSGDTACQGQLIFAADKPRVREAECKVLLRSVAKTESAGDMINKAQEIHDLMKGEQR